MVPWKMLRQVVAIRKKYLFALMISIWVVWMHYATVSRFTFANEHWLSNPVEKRTLSGGLLQFKNTITNATCITNYTRKFLANRSEIVRKCYKKFDISFLKVHKAASTTLMNVFLRFAIEHKLNIVLPSRSKGLGFNYLGYGKTVSLKNIVPLPTNETYNILCNHVVYNKTAFHSIMPKNTVYVGIIREPVSHFKSAALYYSFYRQLLKSFEDKVLSRGVVSEFLKNPEHMKIQTYFVYNRMCFDLGIPKEKFHNDRYVEEYIEELDRDYELVLVMEHFEESLVLMRRTLCWDTKDILYVPLNVMKNKTNFVLDKTDIVNLRKWNSADFKLYEHFYEVFRAKIESLGEDFKEEVEVYKSIQGKVKIFCNTAVLESTNAAILTVPESRWSDSFTVRIKDCKLMMESAIPMMKRLIENAWSRYNESKNYAK